MDRKEIIPDVIVEAKTLLAAGVDYTTIAARTGLTEYVLGILDSGRVSKGRPADGRRTGRCVINSRSGLDAATIRMVQRMLAGGMMRHSEIAREAGVSPNTVEAVAAGKRVVISTLRPLLNDGERFLPKPIRCNGCRAMISVVPCRACGVRGEDGAGGMSYGG